MNIPETVKIEEEEEVKNFRVTHNYHPLLVWLPPVLQQIYQNSSKNAAVLEIVLDHLGKVLEDLEYRLGEGTCPRCENLGNKVVLQPYSMMNKQVITNGNVRLTIPIVYHRCPRCRYRKPEQQELTLPNGIYDRFIVLQACALYTCGCSYENVQGMLATTSDVLPATSTIKTWVKKAGSQAHQVNKEALAELRTDTVQLDEQFFTARTPHLPRPRTPVFETVVLESLEGATLHIGHNEGKQTNQMIVQANLRAIAHHQPERVVADGATSYPGAVATALPQATLERDLVHRARNVRKQPRMKKWFKDQLKIFEEEFTQETEAVLQQEKQEFLKELEQVYSHINPISQRQRLCQKVLEDYEREEQAEQEALQEVCEEQTQLLQIHLHRRLYASQVAAYVARTAQETGKPLAVILNSLPLTCQLEGTNRPNRARERKALCYRHPRTPYVLRGLLVLLRHTVGRGQGNIYDRLNCPRPCPQDNPFAKFPARKIRPIDHQVYFGTPLKLKTFQYGQQHGQQIPPPSIPFPPLSTSSLSLPSSSIVVPS